MSNDELNLMVAQLREMSARMERKQPIEVTRALLGDLIDEHGDDFPPRDDAYCGPCEICGDEVTTEDLSVEAFESCGCRIVCGGCFDEQAA